MATREQLFKSLDRCIGMRLAVPGEAPPRLVVMPGSPVSLVAPTLVPLHVSVLPVSAAALAKLSLAGATAGGASDTPRLTLPVAPAYPSTEIR